MEKPKILVVDDEAVLRESIQTALKREGYELFFAENGAEGLASFHEVSPVLIITDLRMPVMDGLQFLEKLKITPSDPYLTIVLTGHGEDEDVEACYDLGVHMFLRKPFNIFELRGLAEKGIQLKQMQKQMKRAYEKLEQVTVVKDELMTMIAQNLQQPLSAIRHDAKALEETLAPSETVEKFINKTNENVEELLRFIEITLNPNLPEEQTAQIEKVVELLEEVEDEPGVEELQNALEEAILKQNEDT